MKSTELKIKIDTFNLEYTLECGQCFRWKKVAKNEYIGVIADRVIYIRQDGNHIYVRSDKIENLKEVVLEYFDLNINYFEIEKEISQIDEHITNSLTYSSGMRILNQDLFETIISYIISANNNIKRISRSVEKISQMFGKEVEFDGQKYFLFPTIGELSDASVEDLLSCGVGFRARYIVHVVNMLNENTKLINEIRKMSTSEAKKTLLSFQGVGPKVADCILLFALKRKEVFPIDVWVKRIMEKIYFKDNVSLKKISAYAQNHFGEYAGIIQQHLFYNIREANI